MGEIMSKLSNSKLFAPKDVHVDMAGFNDEPSTLSISRSSETRRSEHAPD
jgi:hypothetical protein